MYNRLRQGKSDETGASEVRNYLLSYSDLEKQLHQLFASVDYSSSLAYINLKIIFIIVVQFKIIYIAR